MPENSPRDSRLLHVVDLSPSARVDGVTVDTLEPGGTRPSATAVLNASELDAALEPLCDAGVCRVRASANEILRDVVRWDAAGPWRLELSVTTANTGGHVLTGRLKRGDETLSLEQPRILHENGLLYDGKTLARFDHCGAYSVAATLRHFPVVPLGEGELTELLESLFALPHPPHVDLPTDIPVVERQGTPRPWLTVTSDESPWKLGTPVLSLAFEYGGIRVTPDSPLDTVFDRARFAILHRDRDAERAARERLIAAGAREPVEFDDPSDSTPESRRNLTIARTRLAALILELVRDGWRVDAGGTRYRTPGAARAVVRSGIDWFDLDLEMDYDGATASLPALLEAVRRRESTVTLSDGSIGLVPVEWLARIGPALAAGASITAENVTRFNKSQVGLLDALLGAMPVVSVDETYQRARERMQAFEGITAVDPSPTFTGTLREYQREGLGWLLFLREFGLGGCLADDMGLGKTVQVLALLDLLNVDDARTSAKIPSLIVVPRSLVFNWAREAERFAPGLRVLDFSGAKRRIEDIDRYDVILTTYGTLRSDIAELSEIEFEYAILDEAQAIKNSDTASAKSARLIRARHRLALSGTPIENRLEELWSLFEFLNPGMLGATSTFSRMANLTTDSGLGNAEDAMAGRELLRRALRPVILRRTKEQVAPDLPERCEETLYVDMEPPQRDFYLRLLAETRHTVFDLIDSAGINKSRMHILEALLRLRQAACHPALVNHNLADLPSAKLDALIPTLAEIVEEGHKAVVFSQFTSFLAIVRRRLDEEGLAYEYLDGATRDRERRVDHFQSGDGPPLFLVSLKAGGHGLNLTAADYVYLLDPWWNPAVEAQAIDRAHRIGQTRTVIATRLVARGTVEEKVLELQASKRELADAILNGDQGALGKIGREELELLLSAV